MSWKINIKRWSFWTYMDFWKFWKWIVLKCVFVLLVCCVLQAVAFNACIVFCLFLYIWLYFKDVLQFWKMPKPSLKYLHIYRKRHRIWLTHLTLQLTVQSRPKYRNIFQKQHNVRKQRNDLKKKRTNSNNLENNMYINFP